MHRRLVFETPDRQKKATVSSSIRKKKRASSWGLSASSRTLQMDSVSSENVPPQSQLGSSLCDDIENASNNEKNHSGDETDSFFESSQRQDNQMQGTLDLSQLEELLKQRGIIKHLQNTLNLVLIPLLLISLIGVGFILVWAEEILVPFVVGVFFTYLLRPIVEFLSKPLGSCSHTDCLPRQLPRAPCLKRNANSVPMKRKATHDTVATDDMDKSDIDPAEVSSLLEKGNFYADDNNGKAKNRSSRTASDFLTNRERFYYECQRAKCPRWVAVTLSLMIAMSIFAGLVFFVIDALQAFEQSNIDNYEERAVEIATNLINFLKSRLGVDGSYMLKQIRTEFQVVTVTKYLVVVLFDAIGYTFIVFLFVLYMLFEEPGKHSKRISRSHSRARRLRLQIDSQIQRYIVIKTVISAFVGIVVYVILGPCLDVKMAHLFGVITFLANYIPNIGAVVATLLPIPILILDPDQSNTSMILAIALPIGVHTVIGNFVEPKVFGDTMELHAVVVLLSLSFWYTVWGIPGAILAVPIMAVIRIIVSNIKHPYALVILRLLEGKLPGTAEFHDTDA
mmetsp:Transcript_16407/g.19927  ORF Transcript_16407/g.19927 Transcript_16407/m.19927 type:complete len:565 (+) Transcript_16407:159-1853(+)|eukprot:CAMPEP_0184015936 /NCGR_PEP_ID=MMETSP0954-20121128/6635_1 /TAXON_ID=627963 /ORGANISM="Aplanochytrium sp, Strain PBS07" /LENGTH=564 /DNA_ID=CAMNT_0026296871 /DNA_START=258 /DNA_END=1952 /DNA_ORIENTATION=-